MRNGVLFLFVLIYSIGFSQKKVNLNQGKIKQNNYVESVSYQKIKNKIIVDVSINNKPYKFLFDTGAPFAISKKLYEEFDLPIIEAIDIEDGTSKTNKMTVTTLPELQLGGLTFLKSTGIVFDESTAKILDCFGIDGIIGSNMLKKSVVQFDDLNKKIIITNHRRNLKLNRKILYQPLELSKSQSNPYIIVTLEKNGKKAADRVLFDSGADVFYQMSTKAFNWFKTNSDVVNVIAEGKGSFTWGVHGMADDEHQFVVQIPQFKLNDNSFDTIYVTTKGGTESLMGAEVLKYGKITLDYSKKRFYFESYANINKEELSEKIWAIEPSLQNDKMIIGMIWDKTLEGQVKLGDEILNFNGINYQSLDFCDIITSDNKFINETAEIELKDIETGVIKKVTIKRL